MVWIQIEILSLIRTCSWGWTLWENSREREIDRGGCCFSITVRFFLPLCFSSVNKQTDWFCRSILNGVQYLHAHDIVHRDLKYVFFCSTHVRVLQLTTTDLRTSCIGLETQTVISLSLILACKFSQKKNAYIYELEFFYYCLIFKRKTSTVRRRTASFSSR